MPPTPKSSVALEGFLNKRNTKQSRFTLKQWNKRWFELCGDTLTYAKSPKDLASGDIQVFAVHECEQLKRPDALSFELFFPERSLLLQATSAEEADTWVQSIKDSFKISSGGKALRCPQKKGMRNGIIRRSSSDAGVEDEPTSSTGAKLTGKGHSGSGFRSVQDVTVETQSRDPERPPSPRSLLANPSAFGKFAREGNLFTGPETPTRTPPLALRSGSPPTAATDVEKFEPVPPTPPDGALRNRYSESISDGHAQAPKQQHRRLGVKGVCDDEHGITTIKLATPPTGVVGLQLREDENWLGDDWDEDELSPSAGNQQNEKQPARGKKQGFDGKSFQKEDNGAILDTRDAVQEFCLSPPSTPGAGRVLQQRSPLPKAPPPATTPAEIRADDDWLEEDWDSDEA